MTGGERALDLALREQWPRLVLVAHSQEQVGEAVVAHLPAGMRASASDALRRAWEAPTAPVARGGLETLVASWQQEHPGAASRLAAEVEATTVPQALGVHGAVALRLRSTAPASYLLERCWVAARRVGAAPHGGREWVAAIAAEGPGPAGRVPLTGGGERPDAAAGRLGRARVHFREPVKGNRRERRKDPIDGCAPAGANCGRTKGEQAVAALRRAVRLSCHAPAAVRVGSFRRCRRMGAGSGRGVTIRDGGVGRVEAEWLGNVGETWVG